MVWDPITNSNIAKLESVQRHAIRFCCNDYCRPSHVTSGAWLGGPSIKARSEQSNNDVCIGSSITKLVEIPAGQYLIATGIATRGHHQLFLLIYCSINTYKRFCFPSIVRLWNGLPANEISVSTLEDFKLHVGAGILRT